MNPDEMRVVRRIFEMVAREGAGINTVRKTFDREGLPTPGGAQFWSEAMIRRILQNDLYKAHAHSEITGLVSREVAATLDEGKRYGISWFGRRKVSQKQVAENGAYRTKTKSTIRPQEEQIAVPTPDPGIPRELVDAAREVIKDNRKPPSRRRRFWELSGAVLRCGSCGSRMQPDSKKNRAKYHFYYRCTRHRKNGAAGCSNLYYRSHNAPWVEAAVWQDVFCALTDPEQLKKDLDRMIELKKSESMYGNPEREAKAWLEKLAVLDGKRSSFQDIAAEGLITLDELRTKLRELEEARETALRELKALQSSREEIAELQRDRGAILEDYAARSPKALNALEPEERHRLYQMLGVKVVLYPDGNHETTGRALPNIPMCTLETPS